MAQIESLQSYVRNRLPQEAGRHRWLAGILGNHPSTYSRSPALWNTAFERLGLDAHYVPLDVDASDLERFVQELRQCESLLGINVTAPYKQQVLPFLDELDSTASAIGATNTIVRRPDGCLAGSNTDAQGALACLTRPPPYAEPFYPDLAGRRVLLIGAGGAARAVATALAPTLGASGRLLIANRSAGPAGAMAALARDRGANAAVIAEAEPAEAAPRIDLVINASSRGQAGFFTLPSGGLTCLEPYSALGPANPAAVPADLPLAERLVLWYAGSLADIRSNELAASRVLLELNPEAAVFDLIYAPEETVLLRAARWAGHPTLNGAEMILHQGVAAFLIICADLLGGQPQARQAEVEAAMRAAAEGR